MAHGGPEIEDRSMHHDLCKKRPYVRSGADRQSDGRSYAIIPDRNVVRFPSVTDMRSVVLGDLGK